VANWLLSQSKIISLVAESTKKGNTMVVGCGLRVNFKMVFFNGDFQSSGLHTDYKTARAGAILLPAIANRGTPTPVLRLPQPFF